ncbi:SNARE associated Golgi protein-like protein [Fibrisoma limi BUZ 3]|uniref:TVP38/TMEM64 family membrane protein n=1 Tax=Fibrisoma limi BUZ 3 TaxID=1185876 RepID=I2GS36_9BACT|nr:VTT domain-containing protein [Fibrisoma limi]CCH56714.1 SNARE associated Golgi protein-like protein [Fibrisoma limi BUZ 3]
MKQALVKKLTGPAIAGILLSVTPIIFTSLLTVYAVRYETVVTTFGVWQWVGLTALCCVTSAALTPPTMLALIFGYFLGWQAITPLFLINLGGILFINLLVRWIDHDRFRHLLQQNPKASQVLERIKEREFRVIFYAKLSPVLPFGLTNLLFALSGARLSNIVLGGMLGMMPRTLLAIWTGHEAREIRTLLENPNQNTWAQLVVIGLIVVSIIGLWQVLQRAFR